MQKRTIYSFFKEIADRYPNNPAIIEDDRTLTYSQLEDMADAIAAKFYDRQPKSVGIVMHHGAGQLAHRIVSRRVEEAKKHDCGNIYLETTADGKPVYASLGFRDMADMMKYYDKDN